VAYTTSQSIEHIAVTEGYFPSTHSTETHFEKLPSKKEAEYLALSKTEGDPANSHLARERAEFSVVRNGHYGKKELEKESFRRPPNPTPTVAFGYLRWKFKRPFLR